MLSIRLDTEQERALEEAARLEGITKSELVRRCLADYLERSQPQNRMWELGKGLFGKFDSGRSDLAENHSEILREKFIAKHRNRRQRASGGDVQ